MFIRWNNLFYLALMYVCLLGAFSDCNKFCKAGFVLGVFFFFEIFERDKGDE